MKVITRASSFYLLILGALIMGLLFVMDGYISSAKYSYREYNREYVFKDVPDYKTKYPLSEKMKEIYESSQKINKEMYEYGRSFQRRMFLFDIFYIVMLGIGIIIIFNLLIFTRIVLTDSTLRVYFPPGSALGPFAKPLEIDIKNIKSLKVIRTTPFGPDLKDMAKINWRDVLEINGLGLPGFIFGGLGRIHEQIIKLRPDLKSNYRKRTLAENIANPL